MLAARCGAQGSPCCPFSSHTRSRDRNWELEYRLAPLSLRVSQPPGLETSCHLYNAYYFWKLNYLACLGLQWNLVCLARLLASFGAFLWKSCWWPADREISRHSDVPIREITSSQALWRINHSDVPIHEITFSQALWKPANSGGVRGLVVMFSNEQSDLPREIMRWENKRGHKRK